jgi:uncharacterized tellurite resistance protein B-like protein
MLTDILKVFKSPELSLLRTNDARVAMAALLVRMAKSDEDYAPEEKAMIGQLLQTRYDIEADQANELRKQAEELEAKAPDTVRFTRLIKDTVPYEERQSVVRDLWAIALADGSRDAEENNLMRLLANLLGVNDRDSALARQSLEK